MPGGANDRDGAQTGAGTEGEKEVVLVECEARVQDLNRNSTKQSSGRLDVRAQRVGIEGNDRCSFFGENIISTHWFSPLPLTASSGPCH